MEMWFDLYIAPQQFYTSYVAVFLQVGASHITLFQQKHVLVCTWLWFKSWLWLWSLVEQSCETRKLSQEFDELEILELNLCSKIIMHFHNIDRCWHPWCWSSEMDPDLRNFTISMPLVGAFVIGSAICCCIFHRRRIRRRIKSFQSTNQVLKPRSLVGITYVVREHPSPSLEEECRTIFQWHKSITHDSYACS